MKKTIIFIMTCLALAMLPLHAQQLRKVSGKVTDQKTGDELIGVNVLIKGDTRGTITDFKGDFSIEIPNQPNVVLVFSYIGYLNVEEQVLNRSTINIQMTDESLQLSEVIVVGYGIQRKESVIGSIASISNKTLVSTPVTNISQSLAGKLPGIQVVQPSGEVGSDIAEIYVRGRSTWNNATPLYVVDGIVRTEFAKIDPNEIETINILKDASATAVFGVKGANGVIIITTKRGSLGKPRISVTAQTAVTQPIRIPRPLGAYDAVSLQYLQDWGQFRSRTPKTKDGTTAYDLMLWRTGASPWTHPDVRWMDEVMKENSTQQQYNVNISGGTDMVRYFVSGGLINQNGFYKNDQFTNYNRFNFRSNIDVDVNKNLTASLNIGARVENHTAPSISIWNSWEVYRAAFAVSGREYPIYNPDGSYAGEAANRNVVKRIKEAAVYKNYRSTIESSLSLTHKLNFITEGLAAKVQASFDTQGENGRSWGRSVAEYVYSMETNSYQMFGENRPLSYSGVNVNNNWYKFYIEGGLNYDRSFGVHSLTGLFLANRNQYITNNQIAFADQGLVGRATYDYDRRYFGEINVGYNGSENFPVGLQYGFFPAFAGGWMVSNEDFIAKTAARAIISSLKVRASLGWVGNDKSSDRFIFLQEFNNAGGYAFGSGNNFFNGIQQGDIANVNVTWEVARKQNIGFEADFWNGLLGINFDYFYEYRNKILTNIDNIKPDYVGAGFKVANIGETTNEGFELELKHDRSLNKNFSYYVRSNFTFNRNKVIKKADRLGLLPYQKEEGYPIGTRLMYTHLGFFESYEDIKNSPSQLTYHNGIPSNVEILPGDLKFLDFNNDGVINQYDAYRQGYGTVPEIQYGITIGANWKSFDFSALLQGSANSMFMKYWEIMWAFSNNDNVFPQHNYYWAPEIGQNAQFTRFYGKTWINNERYFSTFEAGSGNYIRLKNVEIGYTFQKSLIQRLKMTNARLYLSSNNTWMWAEEPYLDPDNRHDRGGLMPPTRAFNLGLNINF